MPQIATLVAITQTQIGKKSEETYEYIIGTDKVKFHAHPTRAWNWVVVQQTNPKLTSKVINAMCEAGFEPDSIKTLTLQ